VRSLISLDLFLVSISTTLSGLRGFAARILNTWNACKEGEVLLKELSLCHKPDFLILISFQPDGESL